MFNSNNGYSLADIAVATYGQEIINMTNSIFNRLKKDGELK